MLARSRTPDSWPTGLFVICSAGCGFNSRPEDASPQAVHHVLAHGQGPQLPADQQTTVALQSRPPRRVGLHREGSHHTQRIGTRRRRREGVDEEEEGANNILLMSSARTSIHCYVQCKLRRVCHVDASVEGHFHLTCFNRKFCSPRVIWVLCNNINNCARQSTQSHSISRDVHIISMSMGTLLYQDRLHLVLEYFPATLQPLRGYSTNCLGGHVEICIF